LIVGAGAAAEYDSGTEPDSETTEGVLSCPSKQSPNKAYFEL